MAIEIAYLLTASGGLAVGTALGYYFGIRLYELRRIRRILKIKNPEFWDLEHYAIVDEEETKRSADWARQTGSTPALERKPK